MTRIRFRHPDVCARLACGLNNICADPSSENVAFDKFYKPFFVSGLIFRKSLVAMRILQ